MKKIISGILCLFVCIMAISSPVLALEDNAFLQPQADKHSSTSISEYQLAIKQTHDNTVSKMTTADKTPLEQYKDAFDLRAKEDSDTLKGMGYSDNEIQLLQDYLKGICTFEEAASRASAVLTSDLSCSEYTKTKYTVRYDWVWDKTPVGLGQDGFSIAAYGIDEQSSGFFTKLDSSLASVAYYSTANGKLYKTETQKVDVNGNAVSTKFASYKMDDVQSQWVWAKRGYIQITISPAVSGGKTFGGVRVAGSYGHSSSSGNKIDISVTVNPLSGDITITYTLSEGGKNDTVTTYGKRQSIFNNNGDEYVEL